MILPPKLNQSPENPVYDVLRTRPWFWRLEKSRMRQIERKAIRMADYDEVSRNQMELMFAYAYMKYDQGNGARSFTSIIRDESKPLCLPPRTCIDLWENDQTLYPKGYNGPRD